MVNIQQINNKSNNPIKQPNQTTNQTKQPIKQPIKTTNNEHPINYQ